MKKKKKKKDFQFKKTKILFECEMKEKDREI